MDETQPDRFTRRAVYNALVDAYSRTPGMEAKIHTREFWAIVDRQCSKDETGIDRARIEREQRQRAAGHAEG